MLQLTGCESVMRFSAAACSRPCRSPFVPASSISSSESSSTCCSCGSDICLVWMLPIDQPEANARLLQMSAVVCKTRSMARRLHDASTYVWFGPCAPPKQLQDEGVHQGGMHASNGLPFLASGPPFCGVLWYAAVHGSSTGGPNGKLEGAHLWWHLSTFGNVPVCNVPVCIHTYKITPPGGLLLFHNPLTTLSSGQPPSRPGRRDRQADGRRPCCSYTPPVPLTGLACPIKIALHTREAAHRWGRQNNPSAWPGRRSSHARWGCFSCRRPHASNICQV